MSAGCPACGSVSAFHFLYSKNGCDIYRCKVCGLGRTDASSFDPSSYYTGDYFSGRHADGYQDYVGEEDVLRREFARTVSVIRGYCPGGKLIELGCAYGFFLQEAKPYFEVSGIELAKDAAAHARAQGLRVLEGVADEATMQALGMADVIVLLDVIEHLPNPRATLSLCARHLNAGGIVVITTGDFASLPARLLGTHWRLMTPPQHLWFFTPDSLKRMGEGAGLRLEAATHPFKIVPISLILFQLRRMLGLRPSGKAAANRLGLPVNLFDAMRVVLRRT